MDTNQLSAALASALVRVVESAKPAQEYCFLWIDWWPLCMTKAEWSGWMQAVGAALALAIAIGLPFLQRRKQLLENGEIARHCFVYLGGLFAILPIAAEKRGIRNAMAGSMETVTTLKTMLAEVRPALLPTACLPSWLGFQTTVGHIDRMFSSAHETAVDDQALERSVKQLSESVLRASTEFTKHFQPKRRRFWR